MDASRARVRLAQAGVAAVVAALIAGCGSAYRPVVTPTNPSGPAAQPSSFAAVVSAPSPTSAGIATVIDYSGDTIMATAPIGPGPTSFALDATGTIGYTVNSDGTLTNFPVTSTLQEKFVAYSTLPIASKPVAMFAPSAGLWIADQNQNVADVLTGSPATFKLAVPVAPTPITIFGPGTIGQHNYAISLNNSATPAGSAVPFQDMTCNTAPPSAAQTGEADSIEISSFTVSARIPLGKCPVYAVQSADGRRVFVLNRGSDTVTVISSQNNALNACTPFTGQNGQLVTCHPTLPLSSTAVAATGITPPNGTAGMRAVAGPVYAEYNTATNQLVVADYDGGTISVIDVSVDVYGNDSPTFGTTFTIPVGTNPAAVTVLPDGSRAYTADQGDSTLHVVNLSSHAVVKTLAVVGHPRTVVSTANSLYGKVYVGSPDSPYVTIIRTDLDIVDTTILVQGNVVDVRVSTQDATTKNNNNTSRAPGGGQPCYLPPALMTSTYGPGYTLAQCQTIP
jgi:YVTN family beta-propeller protein